MRAWSLCRNHENGMCEVCHLGQGVKIVIVKINYTGISAILIPDPILVLY